MKSIHSLFILLGAGFSVAGSIMLFNSSELKKMDDNPSVVPNAVQSSFSFNTPVWNIHTLNFAGEKVPIDDPEVIERIDREVVFNTFRTSYSILIYKRAARWFPVIEPILKSQDIPDDFKYLCITESELTNAVSPAGASGFWQFMKTTAPSYGLEVNDEVDERYDVEKATYAACKYFKDAYKKFGSWTLVAASYNMGMGGVQNKINEQKVNSYYDLYLNTETHRYVARILAFKLMFENPSKFGYHIKNNDLYPVLPYKEIEVTNSIPDLVAFAQLHNISYKTLKLWNPWLRKNSLTNTKRKSYKIRIPNSVNYEKEQSKINMYYAQ